MIDFSYMKKKLLEGEETIDDTERVITFIPNQFSDFDSELCLSNVEMKPKEDEGMADEDLRFLNQCQKILHKLAYVRNQYMFSEQFLGKNKYYMGMLLCENRSPSIDSIHNLYKNLSTLNDGVNHSQILDKLCEKCHEILTKRLLKYI